MPHTNHLGDPLPTPTFLEAQLLGRGRVVQQTLVLRLPDRPPDVYPRLVRGHGVAIANPGPEYVRGMLPLRAAELAGSITVLCIDEVRDRQELEERVRTAPCLQMRGAVLVAWVRYLERLEVEEDPNFVNVVDEEALQEYAAMGAAPQVPEALVQAAIAPANAEVASILRGAFLRDRDGPGGVGHQQAAAEAALRIARAAGTASTEAGVADAAAAGAHLRKCDGRCAPPCAAVCHCAPGSNDAVRQLPSALCCPRRRQSRPWSGARTGWWW